MSEATFTTGVMSSGKSRRLIEDFGMAETERIAFSANLTESTGTLGIIESRNGQQLYSIFLNSSDHDGILKYVTDMFAVPRLQAVYIDEVQFLSAITVEQILELGKQNNVDIHFYGLTSTFSASLFDSADFLLNYKYLSFVRRIVMECQTEKCENTASYNARIVDGKVEKKGSTFVSQKSKYSSLCGKCYLT